MPSQRFNSSYVNESNISNDLYFLIINDWKNTSKIKNKEKTKNLKNLIEDVVTFSLNKSKFWFSSIILEEIQKFEIEKSFTSKINEAYQDKKKYNHDFFCESIYEYCVNNYSNISDMKPNYWEQFNKDYHENKGMEKFYKDYFAHRKSFFNGMELPDIKETQFYVNASLPFIAKNVNEEKGNAFYFLLDAIIKYTTKINEFNNTYNLFNAFESDNFQKDKYIINIKNYKCVDLEIEKDYLKKQKKMDLKGIVSKIKNNKGQQGNAAS